MGRAGTRVYRSPARMWLEGLEGICLLAIAGTVWPWARRWLDDLGARPDERERSWPGDALTGRVDTAHVRAIGIAAPAARVWPWLNQFGLDRGGFFSYELLERLAGWKVKNVERLLPGVEPIRPGDGVILAPGEPSIWLSLRKEERHLCFRSWRDEADLLERDPPSIGSWSLYLEPEGEASCRLLLRSCTRRRHRGSALSRAVGRLLEDPLDLVMEQRMLRTVRRLATADP